MTESQKMLEILHENKRRVREENLNKKIIGQEKAVKKLVDSLKKKNIINEKKPYVVLIAGQKGSGKSYLANTFLNYITNKKKHN